MKKIFKVLAPPRFLRFIPAGVLRTESGGLIRFTIKIGEPCQK